MRDFTSGDVGKSHGIHPFPSPPYKGT